MANVKKEFVLREAKQLTAFQKQLVNVVKFTAWRIDKCGAHSVVGKKLVFDLGSDQNVGVKGQGKAGNNKKQYVVENFEKLEKGTLKVCVFLNTFSFKDFVFIPPVTWPIVEGIEKKVW